MATITKIASNLPGYIAYTRKAIIQVIGLATALLALGLLPKEYSAYVASAIAILTTVLHFLTPNADSPNTINSTHVDAGTEVVNTSTLPIDSEGGKHEAPTASD